MAAKKRSPENGFPKLRALHAVFGLECPYSDAERGVAAVLILDFDEEKGGAYRGQDGIARRAGISRRSAQRAIESLLQRTGGPLIVRSVARGREDGSAGRAPNLYTLQLCATVAHKGGGIVRQSDAQSGRGLCAKTEGFVRQNEGGLCVTVTQDLSRDLSRDLSSSSVSTSETVPLELSNPSPKKAAKRVRKPKSKADASPSDPRVTELRDFYVDEFKRAKGVEPILTKRQWPRAMKAFKELLDAAKELEAAKEIFRRAFVDAWHCQNRCQPWEIVNDAGKFIGKPNGTAPRKVNGRDVQGNSADVSRINEKNARLRAIRGGQSLED